MSVTQTQPQNLNVSIRINSPGDDGPVTQINGAGADVDTNIVTAPSQRADAPAPRPEPPTTSALPETWTWIWTSACFGGGGGDGAQAAAAGASWDWRWSCAQDDPIGIDIPRPDGLPLPVVPSVLAQLPRLSTPPGLAKLVPAVAGERSASPAPRARARQESGGGRGHGPPPSAAAGTGGGAGPPAATLAPAAEQAIAAPVRPRRSARHAARARAGVNPVFPSGAGGPSAGTTTALGAVASALLAGWVAVLAGALVLVIPRIWLRRWSGPPWRLPAPRPARLERPG